MKLQQKQALTGSIQSIQIPALINPFPIAALCLVLTRHYHRERISYRGGLFQHVTRFSKTQGIDSGRRGDHYHRRSWTFAGLNQPRKRLMWEIWDYHSPDDGYLSGTRLLPRSLGDDFLAKRPMN